MIKNKLKQTLTAVMALGFLSAMPLNAASYSCDPCYDPCNSCCDDCFGGFEIGADFLLWKPCYKLGHAAQGYTLGDFALNTTTTGKVKYLDSEWTPGVRGYIGKSEFWCDWNLVGSYTYLNFTDSTSLEGTAGTIHSVLMHPSFVPVDSPNTISVVSNYKQQYHSFDILMSKDYCPCQCQTLTPFFGVAGIYHNGTLNHAVTDTSIVYTAKLDSDFWGIGLKAGTTYSYELCDCFGMFATASGTLLAGESKGTNTYNDPSGTPDTLILKESTCLCIPGWHIQLGVNYNDSYCGWDFAARLGYEFVQWHGFPLPRNLQDASDVTASVTTTSEVLGYHGLFAGFSVSF